MEKILKLFKENGIKNIDKEIVNIIYLFNFELNIKTKNSCSGHDKGFSYIQFDENVDDNDIYKLCNYLSKNLYLNEKEKNNCYFWMSKEGRRYNGEFHFNWTLRPHIYKNIDNKMFLHKLEKCLYDYIKIYN